LSRATEQVVLVASSEFTLKSSPVRRTLEQRLIDDLKFALRRANLDCSRVEKDAARFIVFGTKQTDQAAVLCGNVFGVAYAAPAVLLANPTKADIVETVIELARKQLSPGKSFAVRAHRSSSGTISGRQVELEGGSMLLSTFKGREITVDLDDPDVTFYVDLVGSDAYVYDRKFSGPGGLPLSAQWKMLAVLDSGPLSILAALAMMRRGCVVELFIPISGKISHISRGTQLTLAEKVGRLVTRPNYKGFVLEVDQISGRSAGVDQKELVRAIAAKFARENRFRGLIFGDISGRLSALNDYARLSELPVVYPLIGLEPEDLSELSRLAGFDESDLSLQYEAHPASHVSQVDMASLVLELNVPTVQELPL
jgi:tRNA uracil 4-sulfurtransferase